MFLDGKKADLVRDLICDWKERVESRMSAWTPACEPRGMERWNNHLPGGENLQLSGDALWDPWPWALFSSCCVWAGWWSSRSLCLKGSWQWTGEAAQGLVQCWDTAGCHRHSSGSVVHGGAWSDQAESCRLWKSWGKASNLVGHHGLLKIGGSWRHLSRQSVACRTHMTATRREQIRWVWGGWNGRWCWQLQRDPAVSGYWCGLNQQPWGNH